MLWLFIEFGTIWWWLFFSIFFFLALTFVELDSPAGATIDLIIFVTFVTLFTNVNPFKWITTHPWETVGCVVGWFVAGAAWGSFKWWRLTAKVGRKYQRVREDWLKTHAGFPPLVEPSRHGGNESWDVWRVYEAYVVNATGYHRKDLPLQVSNHKGRILTWMCWWPWSLLWWVINDPVQRVFKAIYNQIAGGLQAISNSTFKYDELKPKD